VIEFEVHRNFLQALAVTKLKLYHREFKMDSMVSVL
jgi:hypothetical protein